MENVALAMVRAQHVNGYDQNRIAAHTSQSTLKVKGANQQMVSFVTKANPFVY
jgi:hypothetical protein